MPPTSDNVKAQNRQNQKNRPARLAPTSPSLYYNDDHDNSDSIQKSVGTPSERHRSLYVATGTAECNAVSVKMEAGAGAYYLTDSVAPFALSDDSSIPLLPTEDDPRLRPSQARLSRPLDQLMLPQVIPRLPQNPDLAKTDSDESKTTKQEDEALCRITKPGTRLVRIECGGESRIVEFTQATCERASRMAMPPETASKSVVDRQLKAIREHDIEMRQQGRIPWMKEPARLASASVDRLMGIRHPSECMATFRGPSIRAPRECDQRRMDHLASVKSHNVESENREASFLLCGASSEQKYDRLAESALRANAGNSSVTNKKGTQGATAQTTRTNCKGMGSCAAVQCVNAAFAMALAKRQCLDNQIDVRNILGSNIVEPALFCDEYGEDTEDDEDDNGERYVIVSTTAQMVFNGNPTKLGVESIRSVAKKLAKAELTEEAISVRMGSSNHMLSEICKAVLGGGDMDAVWASCVLIVYLSSDPRGRPLLAATELTDLDVQTACVFESYGYGEITRRARLNMSQLADQQKSAKRRKTNDSGVTKADDDAGSSSTCPAQSASVDDDEEWDDPCLVSPPDARLLEIDKDTGLSIEEDNASIVNDDEDQQINVMMSNDIHENMDGVDGSDDDADGDTSSLFNGDGSDLKVLATKRKRATKGYATGQTADAHSTICFWWNALRSNHRSVINTLVSSTKSMAREGARATLSKQAEGTTITSNRLIVAQSEENAVKSATAIVPLVDRKISDIPHWVAFSVRDTKSKTAVGLSRIPNEAKDSVLHACKLANYECRPDVRICRIGILWSLATHELRTTYTQNSHESLGVTERYALLNQMEKRLDGRLEKGGDAKQRARITRHIIDNTQTPKPGVCGGLTRSFIAMSTFATLHKRTIVSGNQMFEEAQELANMPNVVAAMRSQMNALSGQRIEVDDATATTISAFCNPGDRIEPYCLPAHRLAVGVRLNELLRRFMQGRARKNLACKLRYLRPNGKGPKNNVSIMDTEPFPLATIVDFGVHVPKDSKQSECNDTKETVYKRLNISLHVCLHNAIRAPEMIANITKLTEKRALLLVGSSQASFIGDVGGAISAINANTHINSAKKISCADINTVALLSIWDVYAGGLTNLRPCFVGTAYAGNYGPQVNFGFSSAGLQGHFEKSDHRGHGSFIVSQETVDLMAKSMSRSHLVAIGENEYCETPDETHGIPHGLTAGVHSALADYVDALNNGCVHDGRHPYGDTVTGLFVLPFSAWTQALRPNVESTADSTLRFAVRNPSDSSCAIGKSYISDATCEDEALIIEPLFRRPSMASTGDNPFATSYTYADSVWNAINALGMIAKEVGGIEQLHMRITDWHSESNEHRICDPQLNPTWCADACVLLFGVIYPHQHAIAKPVVPECYAKALPYCAKHSRLFETEGHGAYPLLKDCGERGLSDELWLQARALWGRFSNRKPDICPWQQAVEPMLKLILKKQGSHHNSAEDIKDFREAFNTLCSIGAWLAYSEDGIDPPPTPNPAAHCKTPKDVRRPTMDPVFVAHGANLEFAPRGCLVGIMPFQLRQLYALMLGAHLPGVKEVQVIRNEGGLNLRESSNPKILKESGQKRSTKSISPVQIEADQGSFGSRKAKCYGADLQDEAWNRNALLLNPLFAAIDPPMPAEWRNRNGSLSMFGSTSKEEKKAGYPSAGFGVDQDETYARWVFKKASDSKLTKQVSNILAAEKQKGEEGEEGEEGEKGEKGKNGEGLGA